MEYTVLDITKIGSNSLYVSHTVRLASYQFFHHRKFRRYTFKEFMEWINYAGWPVMCDVYHGTDEGILPVCILKQTFAPSDILLEDFPYIIVVQQR